MFELGSVIMNQTLIAGSEEDFDVICDPCLNEGQRVPASGHCVDCKENLCGACFKLHKKLSALKDHDIREKLTVSHSHNSRESVNNTAEEKDSLTDRCPKHPEELIKFYCKSHHTVGCSVCIHLNHRACDDILNIRDGVADDDELKKIQSELQTLVSRVTSTRSRAMWFKQAVNDSCSKVVTDIRNLKKITIELLDQFENELLEKVPLMTEKTIKALDNMVSTCELLIGETQEIIADIEKKNSKGHNNRLFIKLTQDRLNTLSDEAIRVSEENICESLSFKPDEQLTALLSSLTSLGTLSLVSQPADIKPEKHHTIYVKTDADINDCVITGMIVLPQERLVLTDQDNMSVKLANVTRGKVSEQIKLESKPIDLTRLEGDQIAVTVKDRRYIQVLSVSPTLSKCHKIAVPGLYHGIQYFSDKLFLTCVDPISGLHVCDMSGVLLQQIETDFRGNKLFKLPSRLVLSPDHSALYVSDRNANAVVCLTVDGALISKYENYTLERPRGIAVDDDGYVYVSNSDHTIHQMSPSVQLSNIADVIKYPLAIGHGAGKLYISSNSQSPDNCNNVKVYRLQK